MTLSNEAVIQRWANTDKVCPRSHGNVYYHGNCLYSYGSHFILAIKNDYGAGIDFLVNGDVYSASTTHHTSLAIRNCRKNVQIPFSALRSADIEPRQLEIKDWTSDLTWWTCQKCGREVEPSSNGMFHVSDRSPICLDLDGKPYKGKWNHRLGSVLLTFRNKCYLSSFDEQERGRSAYFLCELPKAAFEVEEAFALLMPDRVRKVIEFGLKVKRQGDFYFIPCDEKLPIRTLEINKDQRIFGNSSHVASVHGSLGTEEFVRGVITHSPVGRDRTHKRLCLGKVWHIPVKNQAVQGWTARGYVD